MLKASICVTYTFKNAIHATRELLQTSLSGFVLFQANQILANTAHMGNPYTNISGCKAQILDKFNTFEVQEASNTFEMHFILISSPYDPNELYINPNFQRFLGHFEFTIANWGIIRNISSLWHFTNHIFNDSKKSITLHHDRLSVHKYSTEFNSYNLTASANVRYFFRFQWLWLSRLIFKAHSSSKTVLIIYMYYKL